MRNHTYSRSLLRSVLAASLLLCVGPGGDLRAAPQQAEPEGELHLTGQFIERLVLLRFGHAEVVLDSPGRTVRLPEGRYAWKEVHLKGTGEGCTYRAREQDNGWLRVSADRPATLNVGGPLEAVVQVQRRGDRLVLSHRVQSADGRRYYPTGKAPQPQFTVTHNGQPVGSGRFEYG